MAHWGKEVRFPFLDERLVKWAIETPAWEKCDFENGEEISGVEAGKRILRLLALDLSMDNVAKEKKRAVSSLVFAVWCCYANASADTAADSIWCQNSQDGERPSQGDDVDILRQFACTPAMMINYRYF
jgi:asparagine synthetase B (glutamine-hydrolysing)